MGFRRVNLLSTEPARAGIELAFLYFYARRFYIPHNKRLMYDLIALVYSLLVFKSATVFFLLMSFLSIAHFRIALISFPILIILIGLAINFFDNRIIQLP